MCGQHYVTFSQRKMGENITWCEMQVNLISLIAHDLFFIIIIIIPFLLEEAKHIRILHQQPIIVLSLTRVENYVARLV